MAKKKIGELLIASGLIEQSQLDQALDIQKKQGGFLGKILVELGFLSEEDVADRLMEQGDYAYLPIACYNIDRTLLKTFPESLCRELGFLPIDKIGAIVTVAVADDIDEEGLGKIRSCVKGDLKIFVTTHTELAQAFVSYFEKDTS